MSDSSSTRSSDSSGGRTSRSGRPIPVEQLRGRQIGRVLIKMGKLKRSQVQEALDIQKKQRGPIGAILVELGYISEEDLTLALAAQNGMERVELGKLDIGPEVIALVTSQMAQTYRVIGFEYDADRKRLSLAMDNPDNFVATDDLRTLLGFDIIPYI